MEASERERTRIAMAVEGDVAFELNYGGWREIGRGVAQHVSAGGRGGPSSRTEDFLEAWEVIRSD